MNRDESWWNRERVAVETKNPREFPALIHTRLREARNWAEVERLGQDNADLIAQLDRASREDVLAALATRERELRNA